MASNSLTSASISENFPSDLVSDILTRLPVKSLSRFKCLSKSMYALLLDPNFVKNHLNNVIRRNNPNIILQIDSLLLNVVDEEWSRARRIRLPFALALERVELSGSCNGLFCISDHCRNEDIFLYNPFTKVFKQLPMPEFDVPTVETTCFTALGFGYHHAVDDYKVIRFVYLYDRPFNDIDSYECEARIYSLATDKWKKLGDVPFHISSRAALWLGDDFLVWKASRGLGATMATLIVSFNVATEVFNEIPRPELKGTEEFCHIEIGVLGGCFTVHHLWRDEGVEIWSMNEFGVKESWVRMFVIGRPVIKGDFFMYLKPLWILSSGEILIERGERGLILYDPKRKMVRGVRVRGAPVRFVATPFMGSLVSPGSHNVEID